MVSELAALAAAVEKISGAAAPGYIQDALNHAGDTQAHDALAKRLFEAGNGLVLLGQFAMSHPDAAWLRSLAAFIADATGSALNLLPHGGNAGGAWLAGAVPHRGPGGAVTAAGKTAAQMLEDSLDCYLLWGIEPDFDIDNPARAMAALREAGKVISIVSHASDSLLEISDVILPLAPLAESEGSLVNLDGVRMNFKAAGKALGDARPGWKILRRLGTEMGLEGFHQFSVEEIAAELQTESDSASVTPCEPVLAEVAYEDSLYRIGELPMYSIDTICRRSSPLQQTVQAQSTFLGLNPEDAARLGLSDGVKARVRQGGQDAELEVRVSGKVPAGGAWLRSASCATRELGHAVAPIIVEVA
jgi:NADH-quinone oxidoreductase subunit G